VAADTGHLADEAPDPVSPLGDLDAENLLDRHHVPEADVRGVDHHHPLDGDDPLEECPVLQDLLDAPVCEAEVGYDLVDLLSVDV